MKHTLCILLCACSISRADDFNVDPSGAQASYATVQAALKAVPAGTATNRNRLLIKPGTYQEQLTVPQTYAI